MTTVFQDIRHLARLVVQKPMFCLVAVLTLALGIGASTLAFAVVRGILLRPLGFGEPEQLVRLYERNRERGWERFANSSLNFVDWRDASSSVEAMAAYHYVEGNLATDTGAVRIEGSPVSTNLFDLLQVRPVAGRLLVESDGAPGASPVAVVSHSFWRTNLGSQEIGETIHLDGVALEIVGVAPPGFEFPIPDIDLWTPLPNDPAAIGHRGQHSLGVVGRLADGSSIDDARAELATITAALAESYPDTNRGWDAVVVPLHDWAVGQSRERLVLLCAAVGLLLLVAGANVTALFLARGVGRRHEIATRTALGATRGRLISLILTESVGISAMAAALGLVLAGWGLRLLPHFAADALTRLSAVTLDGWVVAFGVGLAVLTGLVIGLAPAFEASRQDAGFGLRESGAPSASPHQRRWLRTLVVAEVTLSLVLLVTAGLVSRSLVGLLQVPLGAQSEGVLTLRIAPPLGELEGTEALLAARERAAALYERLCARLTALPQVEAVGAVNRLPLSGDWWHESVVIEGRPRPRGEELDVLTRVYSADYFDALGIGLLDGAIPEPAAALPAVVVDRSFAAAQWPEESPLGRRISFDVRDGDAKVWYTIVGVVESTRQGSLDEDILPIAYIPFRQAMTGFSGDWGMSLVVRTNGDPNQLVDPVRDVVHTEASDLPLFEVATMSDLVEDSIRGRRLIANLLRTFSVVTLLLAGIGLYGTISYGVSQQRREIGVRIALGASPGAVVRSVLADGMRLALFGAALGVAAAIPAARLIGSQLYGIAPHDPPTLLWAASGMIAVTAAATLIPAIRASRVDPLVAIQAE